MAGRSRWNVRRVTLRSRDSYFESDVTYEFQITDNRSGKQVYGFTRNEYADDRGDNDSGAARVTIADDDASCTVTYEDGRTETYPLPPDSG